MTLNIDKVLELAKHRFLWLTEHNLPRSLSDIDFQRFLLEAIKSRADRYKIVKEDYWQKNKEFLLNVIEYAPEVLHELEDKDEYETYARHAILHTTSDAFIELSDSMKTKLAADNILIDQAAETASGSSLYGKASDDIKHNKTLAIRILKSDAHVINHMPSEWFNDDDFLEAIKQYEGVERQLELRRATEIIRRGPQRIVTATVSPDYFDNPNSPGYFGRIPTDVIGIHYK